ncbi:MAG: MOSC domain-containing protein, partial [Bacteroidota bacterium]|nr:MOSC domain-containing protein [Bacteroidota bacterium]
MVRRDVEPDLNPEGQLVSFADAYPFLLIGEAALADLNARLAQPVPINRFRPNLVFAGGTAYEDDTWDQFQIGELPFRAVRGCGRCVLTTIDQATATKNPASEPLRTLATYRQADTSTLFGQNVTGPGAGHLRVGDALTVLSRK